MAWKKKEKELTEKEALQQARIDLAPRWYRSSPLLAAIEHEGKVQVVPLETHFAQSHWLLCFSDPTTLTGQTALVLAREWQQRYANHHLKILCIQELDFELQRERMFLEKIAEEFQLSTPLMLDKKREFLKGFGVSHQPLPQFVFWSGGKVIWSAGLNVPFKDIELKIQHFLRSVDKGLPLPNPWSPLKPFPKEMGTFRFGASSRSGFESVRKDMNLVLNGQWQENADHIRTQDPEASIQFVAPATCVALLAKSVSDTIGETRVFVEVNEGPVYESLSAGEMIFTESGEGSLGIETFRLYRVLQGLSPDLRKITFRFPLAKRVPIGLFALSFFSLD